MQEERLALNLPRMGNIQPVICIAHEGLIGYQGHELFKLLLGSVSKVEMAMFIPPVQRHSG
jgi:hypothetical protein